jgi:hypothetical protein
LGVAVAVGTGALLVPSAHAAAMRPMPGSTVRQQVAYVLAHRRPGDVIVVGAAASFAFAYYWPERPTFAPSTTGMAVRFQVEYPGRRDLVLVRHSGRLEILDAFRDAAGRPGSHRVWLVLAEAGDRNPAWNEVMDRAGRVARRQRPRLVVVQPGGHRR